MTDETQRWQVIVTGPSYSRTIPLDAEAGVVITDAIDALVKAGHVERTIVNALDGYIRSAMSEFKTKVLGAFKSAAPTPPAAPPAKQPDPPAPAMPAATDPAAIPAPGAAA